MANSGASEANANAMSHTDMSHASPNNVLSHNMAIAGKISTLTGEDATTACNGFKSLGRRVAAAHVAKLEHPRRLRGAQSKNHGKQIG